MDGYRDIAEKCFWAGGGNDYLPYPVEGRIGNSIEFCFFGFVSDLNVGEACLVSDAKVYHAFATVNKLVIPELFEGRIDGFDNFFVEGEYEVVPACADTKRTELKFHVATLLVDKVPYLPV